MTVIPESLAIAEERIEWASTCADGESLMVSFTEQAARETARGCDESTEGCGPHRVVSRRVITTCWTEQ